MSETVVRLSFPAKPDYLLLARLALAGLARSLPLGAEELADLKLAVTEACGNAVRHAYGGEDGSVGVEFVLGDKSLEVIVQDQGSGLEVPLPEQIVDPTPLTQPVEGGMGMAIIRAIVDELDVRSGENGKGTVVHMTKFLAA
jgi:serine/threonine-protein kinase RsbW